MNIKFAIWKPEIIGPRCQRLAADAAAAHGLPATITRSRLKLLARRAGFVALLRSRE